MMIVTMRGWMSPVCRWQISLLQHTDASGTGGLGIIHAGSAGGRGIRWWFELLWSLTKILIAIFVASSSKWGACPELMTLPAEDLQPARYYIPPSLSHQSFILVLNHLLSQTQSHSQFSTDRTSPFGSSENLQLWCICFFIPSSWLYILFSFTLRENLTWIYSAP